MSLQKRFRAFSEAGIRSYKEHDLLLVGVGCWQWSWPIVAMVITDWLEGDHADGLRNANWDLGMVVGTVVLNHTRDDFTWSIVTQILKTSGRMWMDESIIASFSNLYPLGASNFSYGIALRSVKRVVQEMAMAILWIEALTFIDYEGFGDRLK